MAARDDDERELERVVAPRLRRWLDRVTDAVLAPFRSYRGLPDVNAVYGQQAEWDDDVDTILATVSRIALSAWSEATNVPPVSRHAFIMASLADARNFLVAVPDEVADLVFAEITDGLNAGEPVDRVADRVERVLSWTATPRWPGRARAIAWTETTRARGAGTLAAGTEQSRVTGRVLSKTWRAHNDEKTRIAHRDADNQTVPFWAPFQVGGESLMAPGDPTGSPENVINCRCDMTIGNEVT